MSTIRLALLALLMAAVLGACAPTSSHDIEHAEVTLPSTPVLIVDRPLAQRMLGIAADSPEVMTTEAIFEVRLEITRVLAGAPEWGMVEHTGTVLLRGNAGNFQAGANEIVVALTSDR